MYADGDGESHFEDLPLDFQVVDATLGRTSPLAAREIIFNQVSASPRLDNWHHAPRRQYVIVLSGEFDLVVSDGRTRRVGPGSAYIVEDVSGKGHRMRVPPDAEVCVAVIPLADAEPRSE
jgi:uncharacterized cupin superfamily protein